MAIDFEMEFSNFVSAADGSAIKDIYAIIPTLSNTQIKIVNALNFYIKKYDLPDVKELLEDYLKSIKVNKNLNFVKSMNIRNLLKAYTQEELIKGIKVQAGQQKEQL